MRYQNYAKRFLNLQINNQAYNERRDVVNNSYRVAPHLEREIQRIMADKGITDKEAFALMMRNQDLEPVKFGTYKYQEHLKYVEKIEDKVETEKEKRIEMDAECKENYPKSYLVSKVQQMVLGKKGLSDFEIFSGVSEIFLGRTQI